MATSRLTQRERSVLRYHGMPADTVSVALRMRVHEVLEIRAQLRERGVTPTAPALRAPVIEEQLSFDQTDLLMRTNRAPQVSNVEIGWTTSTDPAGW